MSAPLDQHIGSTRMLLRRHRRRVLLAVALLFFYRIDKAMENRLERELGERRVAAEVTA